MQSKSKSKIDPDDLRALINKLKQSDPDKRAKLLKVLEDLLNELTGAHCG